jgi:hypothetical protein
MAVASFCLELTRIDHSENTQMYFDTPLENAIPVDVEDDDGALWLLSAKGSGAVRRVKSYSTLQRPGRYNDPGRRDQSSCY